MAELETPEQIAERLVRAIENPNFPGHTCLLPIDALRDGIRDAIALALTAQREWDAQIAHDRATQWDAIKEAHPDDGATYTQADARWHEACDIAALILG